MGLHGIKLTELLEVLACSLQNELGKPEQLVWMPLPWYIYGILQIKYIQLYRETMIFFYLNCSNCQ